MIMIIVIMMMAMTIDVIGCHRLPAAATGSWMKRTHRSLRRLLLLLLFFLLSGMILSTSVVVTVRCALLIKAPATEWASVAHDVMLSSQRAGTTCAQEVVAVPVASFCLRVRLAEDDLQATEFEFSFKHQNKPNQLHPKESISNIRLP